MRLDWASGSWRLRGEGCQREDFFGKKASTLCREGTNSAMNEQKTSFSQDPSNLEMIPEDVSVEMRRLAHDLSNALEIIIQTSYLLSTTEMKEPAAGWLRMLDDGVQKALNLNLELRTYIKQHTPN